MTRAILATVSAAVFWFGWIMVSTIIELNEKLADAEVRAEQVYVPTRSKWLCAPSRKLEGGWFCVDPEIVKGKS